MRYLTLDALQIIDTIARTGSFTAAAAALHKVPSTISYTINKLESQMNVRFFERNGPRITLTPIGKQLLEDGRCLLTSANDLENKLQQVAQGVETQLTLTLDALVPLANLAPYLHDFFQTAYQTQLYCRQEALTGTWEALIQRRADLIIAAGTGPAGGGYQTHTLGALDFTFCVAPNHPLANASQPIKKSQLMAYHAITIADSAQHLPLRTTGLYAGQKQLSVNHLSDKIALQKAGLGHGFLPTIYIQDALQQGELVALEVAEPKISETFYLAWRNEDRGVALNWWIARLSQFSLFHLD